MKKFFLFVMIAIAAVEPGIASSDYTYSCWLNGWRKDKNDSSADLFGIETSRYGFVLDVDDFSNCGFGYFDNAVSYEKALEYKAEKLKTLPPARLLIEVNVDGERYIAKTCSAGLEKGVKRLSNARLWESGRYVQHYDFTGLEFRNAKGEKLACESAVLDVVAWPDSLTFNLRLTPSSDLKNVSMCSGFTGKGANWFSRVKFDGLWKKGQIKSVSLTCGKKRAGKYPPLKVNVEGGGGVDVSFDKTKNCYTAFAQRLKRKWKTGYTDIRNYDEFKITVNTKDENRPIPFLLDLRPPANITGLCPILCDEQGRPTAIPVQLSKNWHYKEMGPYLMAYTMLPPENKTYILRIAYGFYGKLPTASHSQLSLIGWGENKKNGNNGRWDQLAIGCWGETICFDMDMSCVDVAVTDIRMLMARDGLKGKKWSWTDAGWGGDWLYIKDASQDKYFFNGIKTAYLSHGPCLTDVRHSGYYGMNKEIDFKAQIQTLRTDDYARTFQKFKYRFTTDVSPQKICLFKLGRTFHYTTPEISFGNIDGLIERVDVPDSLKRGQAVIDKKLLNGKGPWWVTLPGDVHNKKENMGTGYRSLIIRGYKVTAGGETYTNPTINAVVFKPAEQNIDIELLPPSEIKEFKKGDTIELDLELVTLHRKPDDYYGPNETYRKHLAEKPFSWETTYREAIGNNLDIKVSGGVVLRNYPIVIKATKRQVEVFIKGGVGAVPVQFEGLGNPKGCTLFKVVKGKHMKFDQSVHGNDFWQSDYDPLTETYKVTYNLPLDAALESKWVLSCETELGI